MLYRDISIYIALQFSHCNPLNSGSVSHTVENKSFDSLIIHPIISLWCHITAASKNNQLVLKASGAEVNRKDDASDCWQTAVSAGQRRGSNDDWMLVSWIYQQHVSSEPPFMRLKSRGTVQFKTWRFREVSKKPLNLHVWVLRWRGHCPSVFLSNKQ